MYAIASPAIAAKRLFAIVFSSVFSFIYAKLPVCPSMKTISEREVTVYEYRYLAAVSCDAGDLKVTRTDHEINVCH